MPFEYYFFIGAIFILGSIIGSFLNVCIYRIPAGVSIVTPRSRCPHCETLIRWYHNIPILSWLLLKGKCAYCSADPPREHLLIWQLCAINQRVVSWWQRCTAAHSNV